eukprot:6455939-Amphidinium_carterae.1
MITSHGQAPHNEDQDTHKVLKTCQVQAQVTNTIERQMQGHGAQVTNTSNCAHERFCTPSHWLRCRWQHTSTHQTEAPKPISCTCAHHISRSWPNEALRNPQKSSQHCPGKTRCPSQPQYGHPAHTHPRVRRLRTATTHEVGAPSSNFRRRTNLPFKRRMHHMDTHSMANPATTSLKSKNVQQNKQATPTEDPVHLHYLSPSPRQGEATTSRAFPRSLSRSLRSALYMGPPSQLRTTR